MRSVLLACSYKSTESAQDRLSPQPAEVHHRLSHQPRSLQSVEHGACAISARMVLGQQLCQWITQQLAQQIQLRSRPIEKLADRKRSMLGQPTRANRLPSSILFLSLRRYTLRSHVVLRHLLCIQAYLILWLNSALQCSRTSHLVEIL